MRTSYEIQMLYDSAAINAMTKMTYDLYHPEVAGRIYLISLALLISGSMGTSYSDSPIFIVLLAFGCFIFMASDYGAKATAKQIIASLQNEFPQMKFSFRQDNMVVTTPKETGIVHYDIISRLAENRQYLFLFSSDRAAYVLNKGSIPSDNLEEFKAFLQEKTGGLDFERAAGFKTKLLSAMKKK